MNSQRVKKRRFTAQAEPQAEVTETEPTATPEELPKEEERGEEPEQSEKD